MSEQTAIDDMIVWLERQIELESNRGFEPQDVSLQGQFYGRLQALREALDHARAARERQQG